jgi:hypothetical protein
MLKDTDLNENEKEILKFVMIANCSVKSAAQWPKARRAYLMDCREKLEKALVYLEEELDGGRKDS